MALTADPRYFRRAGEKAFVRRLANRDDSTEPEPGLYDDLRHGDLLWYATDDSYVIYVVVENDGPKHVVRHDDRDIFRSESVGIENPVSFYDTASIMDVQLLHYIWLDVGCHRGIIRAAAGGRNVVNDTVRYEPHGETFQVRTPGHAPFEEAPLNADTPDDYL